jgi:uncharacterized protein involved in exopolysaccharide biosynthesis
MNTPTAAPDRATDARDPYAQEVSLAQYVSVLWRHRLTLLAVPVLAVILSVAVSSVRSPTYEATSTLVVSPSKLGDEVNQNVSIGTYQAIVNNPSVVMEAMKKVGLDKPPHNLDVSDVQDNHLTVQAVQDTFVIRVRARLRTRELATNFADAMADQAVALARNLSQEDTVAARDTIKSQLDDTSRRLQDAEERLERYRKEADVESLGKDVDALLKERETLLSLQVGIGAERAKIAAITKELEGQDRVRNARRSTVTRPKEDSTTTTFRDELLDPYINPVHETLVQQLAEARAELAVLAQKESQVQRAVAPGSAGDRKLSELHARKAEISRLESEAKLARAVFDDISKRYEEARLQVAGRSPQLQAIGRAQGPREPVSPRMARDAVIAAALAFVVTAAVLLLYAAFSGALPRSGDPVGS